MNKKIWYIWFSLFAFIILFLDTQRILDPDFPWVVTYHKPSKIQINFTKNIVFSFVVILMLPSLFITIIVDYFTSIIPEWCLIIYILQLFLFYLQGVYMAYRICKWREKNLPKDEDIPKYNDTQ